MTGLLDRVSRELGLTPVVPPPRPVHAVPLPSRLATEELAWASVAAVVLASGIARSAPLDPDRIACAYRSDRLRIDGEAPDVWSPYSGFWRAADGWVRTHGNYAHHARALLHGLRLPPAAIAADVGVAIEALTAREAAHRITAAGGLAVTVGTEEPGQDARLRTHPLIELRPSGGAALPRTDGVFEAAAPLRGIRVLDLTRMVAGPVCTRTLALLGADVLRVDPPHLPEPEWQHLDTGHGKRTTVLDARSPEFAALLRDADVVVLGYRPASLARLGLSPDILTDSHPGLVVAQLSAWGDEHPDRAGFDSLVQAASGIAMVESPDGVRPGVLPAQALDHSAGYLLAAGICAAIARRRTEGGSWHVRTSLRRIAAELLGMPRRAEPPAEREIDLRAYGEDFLVDGRVVTTARSVLPGFSLAAPHPWGADAPGWAATRTARA
ncbi:hypothetical protein HD600_000219 [Microbacterium ginsengiterrae]|uniref:CoA transferase family III n=1 Tax=Microbacterium ginsengiterrae TaxID=546115 RepID=A0A7W9CAQ9_9MICO|nr:CoA transferase [Microbacterium ginsengiterrae]MBB5741722.1 hypothetical protein [Microbacterium ginsengiterrae]